MLNLPIVQDWELRVQGCAAYTEEDITTSIEIAAAGGIPGDVIISGVLALDDVTTAFERAAADSSGKVLVAPAW